MSSILYFLSNLGMGAGGTITPTGPATLREAVFFRLNEVPGLSAMVGGRIYPFALPQNAVRPAVSFSVASRTFGRWFSGSNGTSQARVRISCWSNSELEAAEIADKIRRYFDAYQGWIGATYIYYTNLENEIDLPEPKGKGTDEMIYQVVLDFSIRHRVAQPAYT